MSSYNRAAEYTYPNQRDQLRLQNFINGIALNGQQFQCFVVAISNVAGTLKHAIFGNTSTDPAFYANKINGASVTQATTPTVGAGTGFTSGLGITGSTIVLDTADQNPNTLAAGAFLEYYDGAVAVPSFYVRFTSRNVNSVTRYRFEINCEKTASAAVWTINTTNLPSGTSVLIRVFAFLA